MAIYDIDKVNSRLRFLYRQNRFLNVALRRLMIQRFLDFACNAWYQDINKILKIRLQADQNKYIRCCLKLNGRSRVNSKDFKKINWLPIHERVSQCSLRSVCKYFTKNCPN